METAEKRFDRVGLGRLLKIRQQFVLISTAGGRESQYIFGSEQKHIVQTCNEVRNY